jgi:ferredoxin-NADP reductase
VKLVVSDRREVADRVISLHLRRPDGSALPHWTPGAHVDVRFDDFVRHYSLCGAVEDSHEWRLGILHEIAGSGGSEHIVRIVTTGSVLDVSEPRNNFPLLASDRYLFLAGGIGITPILPMLKQAERSGSRWQLVYGGRSRRSMAFLDELAQYGDNVLVVPQDESGLIDIAGALEKAGQGTLVYACGPEPMLAAVEAAMTDWPRGSLHVERFQAAEQAHADDDTAFEVEFVTSGVTATVPAGTSILEVAESLGLPVFSSCQEGTCGTCVTPLLEGKVDHRDAILSVDERARQDSLCICVSRAASGCELLRLDL